MSASTGSSSVVADDIRVSEEREGAVLSCRLRGDGLPERLWFRLSSELGPALVPAGDAFLPPLLLVAMERSARLVIDGEVSAALLRTAPAIQDVFAQASPDIGRPMRVVPVEAQARATAPRGAAAGTFFSGGVDSFYTVLRNLERYPAPDPRRLTYLILTQGFDIELSDEGLFAMVRDRLGKAAEDLGTRLLPLATNARAAVTGLPWDYAHGAAMAGVGLALAPLLHTCFIAGSNSIRTCQFWGTHPGLDPLWSTETLEFVSDGPMLGKIVKIPVIARSPVARRVLRVCWQNPGGVYNCARCEKCLRTMVILAVCGELGRVETLPAALDPDALAQLHIEPIYMGLWGALACSLAAGGHGSDLVAAVERALTRTRRRRSRLGRAELSLLDTLARIGLTRRRMETLDQRLLGGHGARALRRVTGRK